MACSFEMTGQIVVGGDGCGCSGSGAPRKIQPLALGCASGSYGAIQSTDCAVTIQSPSAFVPLPIGAMSAVEFLFLSGKGSGVLRWGGSVALLTGTQILGTVTFVGGEIFAFEVGGVLVSTTFLAGARTITQIVNLLNASAVAAGLGYLPASVDSVNSRILIQSLAKSPTSGLEITAALALVGFAALAEAFGVAPTEVAVEGTFLNQWPRGAGVSDLEIRGNLDVTVLAAGVA